MLLSQDPQASTMAGSAEAFYFGGFQLQPDEQRLLHHGVAVTLQTRALDVLTLLVSQPGRLVTRADLLRRVWRGLVVEDNNLNVQVSALRKVLGKSAISTVPGKGYRFNWSIRRGPWPPRADTSSAPMAEPVPAQSSAPAAEPVPAQRPPNAAPWPTLLGRQHELTQLLHSLRQAQWVSLAGPPGVGKSRLAQVAAWRHAAATGVSVGWVDLAPVCALQEVVLAVAVALNLPVNHDLDDPWWALRQQLGGVSALLVLDNADRLPAELGAVLAGWLAGAPGLRVLVTRQRPLHQRGEWVLRLDGLALPPSGSARPPIEGSEEIDPHALAAALAVPSVALLVQQVKLADAGFEPQAADLPALCTLAHALDGWPLALEQAAARVPALGLAALPALMTERLNLLTAPPPAVPAVGPLTSLLAGVPPPRLLYSHPYQPAAARSLRRAVAASHARLTPRQQRLFRRLAVFEGGAELVVVQQVVSDPLPAVDASGVPACHGLSVDLARRDATDELQLDDVAVALELAALADASVLQTISADPGGEAPIRSGLWRNMRALALELAVASGEMAALQHAHAAAMVRQAKGWLEDRSTGCLPHHAVVQRCQQAQGHLRQAWAWANGRHHPDDIVALVHALWLATEGHDDALQTTCLRLLERRAPCTASLRLWADVCLPPAGAPPAGMGGSASTATLHSATQAFVALARAQLRALQAGPPHAQNAHNAPNLSADPHPPAHRYLHHALCARVTVLCRSGEIERARPLWFEANRLRGADWPPLDQLAGATADLAMQQALSVQEAANVDEALAEATQRLLLHAHQAGCHWLVGALHWLDSLVATRAWPQATTLAHRVSQQAAAAQPPAWAGRLHLACAAAWLGSGRKGAARQALRRAWRAHVEAGLTAHGQPGWWQHAWLALLDQRLDDAALWLGLAPPAPLSLWPHPPSSQRSPHAQHPAQAALNEAALTPDALAAGRRAVGAMDDIELTARALKPLQDVP